MCLVNLQLRGGFMKQREFERWHKYRKIGRLKFILLWTVYFTIVINIANFVGNAIKGNFTFEIDGFFSRLIIGCLTGTFFGAMMWKGNEREYNNHISKKDSI